jgi:hypothetical protein
MALYRLYNHVLFLLNQVKLLSHAFEITHYLLLNLLKRTKILLDLYLLLL